MAREVSKILQEAMNLPPEARAALAGSLFESLDTERDANSEGLWKEEVGRRLREIDTGTIELVDWSSAQRRLRGRLKG